MRGLAALLLALSLALPASAQAPKQAPKKKQPITHADILKNFEIIAFGAAYSGRKYQYVRKWAQPIRIGLQGPQQDLGPD